MPSRVLAISHFWASLTNCACSRGVRVAPIGRAGDLGRPRDLPDAVADQRLGAVRIERAVGPLNRRALIPDAEQLRDLLVDGHAGEQIRDTDVDRLGRVAIDRVLGQTRRGP